MGVPQLETCCCGCTLKTGTKIIGWLYLISSIVLVVVSWMALAGLYYIEAHPDNPDLNQYTRGDMTVRKAVTIGEIVLHLTTCAFSVMLLLGVYQNKARLVYIWVVSSLTITIVLQGFIIGQIIMNFNKHFFIGYLFGLSLRLYSILVVYSFYREIKKNVAGCP